MLSDNTQPVNELVKIFNMTWIRDRRKELNYTQDDVARELQLAGFDVVRTSISHWEQGKVSPPYGDPDFVVKIARILKTDILTVLQHAGYPISSQHSDIAERLARLVDTLPQEKQQLAFKLVEQLLD